MVYLAPFETFSEYGQRVKSDAPYSEAFINRCREKAIEYAGLNEFLRDSLLREIERSIPMHYRGKVFVGISFRRVGDV